MNTRGARAWTLLVVLLVACHGDDAGDPVRDAGARPDAGPPDAGPPDGGPPDGGPPDGGPPDAGPPDAGLPGDACTASFGVPCAAFEEAYLKADEAVVEAEVGYSLAIDGDTLAVGSRRHDTVYVFVRRDGTWSQQARLTASNADPDSIFSEDLFGLSLDLDGDTLAVGAPWEDGASRGIDGDEGRGATNSGAVYVFERSGETWSQRAYVKASNAEAQDDFGMSVALDGDTLAVGAIGERSAATGIDGDQEDNGASFAGAAYVFTRTGGVWSQQAYVKASNTGAGDLFGLFVALDGDTLVVGAPWEDGGATGIDGDGSDNSLTTAGAAYVFTRTAGTWSQQAYVKPSHIRDRDVFGDRFALDGDTLAVGTDGDGSATGVDGDGTVDGATDSGAVYVFTRTDGVWSEEAYIKASNTGEGDRFSDGIALDGDTLVVGAPLEDGGGTGLDGDEDDDGAMDAGAVYVFRRSEGVWSQLAYVKSSHADAGDSFGFEVALDGATLVVGAPLEDSAATGVGGDELDDAAADSGAVYIRRIAP